MSGDLSDADLDELIGDGSCTHLPQVRAAIEIRQARAMTKRLEALATELDAGEPRIAAELRSRMRGK